MSINNVELHYIYMVCIHTYVYIQHYISNLIFSSFTLLPLQYEPNLSSSLVVKLNTCIQYMLDYTYTTYTYTMHTQYTTSILYNM